MIQSAVNSIAGTLAKAIIGREVMKPESQKEKEFQRKERKKEVSNLSPTEAIKPITNNEPFSDKEITQIYGRKGLEELKNWRNMATKKLQEAQEQKRAGQAFSKQQLHEFSKLKQFNQDDYLRRAQVDKDPTRAEMTFKEGAKREIEWNEVMKK